LLCCCSGCCPAHGPIFNYCGWITLVAIGVGLSAAAVWHKPMRLLITSSILLFDIPVFFLVFSSLGRFYNTALPAMLVLLATFAGDRGYWRALYARPVRAGAACADARHRPIRRARRDGHAE
jgi:hypothetical protein